MGRENLSPNFETSRLGTLSAVQKCTSLKPAAREVRALKFKTCDGHAEFGRLWWSDGVFQVRLPKEPWKQNVQSYDDEVDLKW